MFTTCALHTGSAVIQSDPQPSVATGKTRVNHSRPGIVSFLRTTFLPSFASTAVWLINVLLNVSGCCRELHEANKSSDFSLYFVLFFLEAEMKGCSVLALFPQWQMQWEHLATSSPWSCGYSSSEFCHLKEVLRSAQHSRHIPLSACFTCTHLESVRTRICSRKLRACPLLRALLRNRFCRCTLKRSVLPSHGLLRLLLSPRQMSWPTSVVLQGHFSWLSLHSVWPSPQGWGSRRLPGFEAQPRLLSPTSEPSLKNLFSV